MGEISVARSGIADTACVALVTLAALLSLGMVLAYWTWAVVAPRPEPQLPVAPEQRVNLESAKALFGVAQQGPSTVAPNGAMVRLLGVAAATRGRRGYAVVQPEGGRIIGVREGEDIAPGLRLAEVRPRYIVLMRNGLRETLAWPEKSAAAETTAARPVK